MESRKGNPKALKRAAAKRKKATRNKIFEAIERIASGKPTGNKKGTRITPASVAREAGVGRDTIYRYRDAIAIINQKKLERKSGLASDSKSRLSSDEEIKLKTFSRLNKQLSIDKASLARENNRLQVENEEFKDRIQKYQQEIHELRLKLAERNKVVLIKGRR